MFLTHTMVELLYKTTFFKKKIIVYRRYLSTNEGLWHYVSVIIYKEQNLLNYETF